MLTFTLTEFKPEGKQQRDVQAPTDEIMWSRACNLFHNNKEAAAISQNVEGDRLVIRIASKQKMLYRYERPL